MGAPLLPLLGLLGGLLLGACAGAGANDDGAASRATAADRSAPSAVEDPLGLLGLELEQLQDRHGRATGVEALHGVQAVRSDPRASGDRIHAVHRYLQFDAYLNLEGVVIGYTLKSGASGAYGSCPDPDAG